MTRPLRTALAVLVAATALAACGSDEAAAELGTADTAPPSEVPAPAASTGYRLVGFDDIAIEVPSTWATNKYECGWTPLRDTVLVDLGNSARGCLRLRPAGVESVHVMRTEGPALGEARDVTIGGRAARRETPQCAVEHEGEARICRASVLFPAERVLFRAESSTGKAEVNEILDRIRVLPDAVGVPGFRDNQGGQEGSGATYLAELERAGFKTEVREERQPGQPEDRVLTADPAPGTMLRPGDTVTVTINPPALGPSDQVHIFLDVRDANGKQVGYLSDEQVRAGSTLRMPVGGTLRVYSKNSGFGFGGELDGRSLVATTGPAYNGAAYWRGAEAGTTRLTVTVRNGEASEAIGVVTVIVS